jgi:hypothetical protein
MKTAAVINTAAELVGLSSGRSEFRQGFIAQECTGFSSVVTHQCCFVQNLVNLNPYGMMKRADCFRASICRSILACQDHVYAWRVTRRKRCRAN